MSQKSKLILASAVSVLAIGSGYFWFHDNPAISSYLETDIATPLPEATVSNELLETTIDNPSGLTKENRLITNFPADPYVKKIDENQETKLAKAFVDGPSFKSVENLNAVYLNSDGSVSMESLKLSFQQIDFTDLITKLNEISNTEFAEEREAKLKQTLYDEMGAKINSEFYACAGKLCAVTFTSVEPIEQQVIDRFAGFSGNYTFTNRLTNEHGESITRLLLIAADDPSQLTVR